MPMFRKKPVVIEARQWFKQGEHPEVSRYEYWREDLDANHRHASCGHRFEDHGQITTLESFEHRKHQVCPGDWIICGVKGEFYSCKPDIFEATYETA